tara:strand:+ start:2263 stop:3171 length:909 start_codon:yes stop_codon:yes gene_type:complete
MSQAALAHANNLTALAQSHGRLIDEALMSLELEVAKLIDGLPTQAGALNDLSAAIDVRRGLREAIEAQLLLPYNDIVDSLDEVVAGVASQYQAQLVGGILPSNQASVIAELKRLTFSGFEDIANSHLDTMARLVYQSTLVGEASTDLVQRIRHSINGVYIRANSDEINDLVEFVRDNKDDPAKVEAVDQAISRLQREYASDRAGQNLKRYVGVYSHDSLMQFSANINYSVAKELGADKWVYFGALVEDSRPFCQKYKDQVLTTDQINEIWANETWAGKASGNPFTVRGGYRCQHHFRATFDD